MVDFVWNFTGHNFERGLMILRSSLTASLAGLELERVKVQAEYDAYNAGIAAGAEPEGQWEEGIGWLHEKSQEFEFDLDMIDVMKSTVRKTHVIAIYHLWERIARQWTGTHGHEGHDDLAKAVEASGLRLDPRLKKISLLNNALKHNSQKDGPKLLAAWSEVLPRGFEDMIKKREAQAAEMLEKKGLGDGQHRPDWFEAITLTDAQIDDVFGGIRESGPRANTARKKE